MMSCKVIDAFGLQRPNCLKYGLRLVEETLPNTRVVITGGDSSTSNAYDVLAALPQ
jgi:hypothetical protein